MAKFEKNLYVGFRATLKFWKFNVALNRSIVVIVQRIREQESVVILWYSMQIVSLQCHWELDRLGNSVSLCMSSGGPSACKESQVYFYDLIATLSLVDYLLLE